MPSPADQTPADLRAQARVLRALARSVLAGADGADDVVQDAYVAALRRAPAGATGSGWLAAVVRNLARRLLRDRGRQRHHETAAAQRAPAPPTDDVVAGVEMHRDLAVAVLELAEPYRTALVLRFWHDLPPRVIARRLGIPVETVKTRIQRGLAQVRARLDRRYGDRAAWLVALLPIAQRGAVGWSAGAAVASFSALVTTMNTKLTLAAAAAALLCITFAVGSLPDAAPTAQQGERAHVRATKATAPRVAARRTELPAGDEAERAKTGAEPTCEVTGRVVADATGAPVAGARFRLTFHGASARFPDVEAHTDDEGRFRLAAPFMSDGKWIRFSFALARAKDLATRVIELGADVQERIAGRALDLGTIRLVRGVALRGRVVDQAGRPLQVRARLLLWDPEEISSQPALSRSLTVGFTDTEGRFDLEERVTPLAGGALVLAAVTGTGAGWARLGVAPGQEHLDPVELALQPNGGVAVCCVDETGAPVAGATVCATPYFLPIGVPPMFRQYIAPRAPLPLPELNELFLRRTDAAGRAILAALPMPTGQAVRDANHRRGGVGGYLLCAHAAGYRQAVVTAQPGTDGPTAVEVRLQRKREVAIEGRVTSPDGVALEGIGVRDQNGGPRAVTDAQGRFALSRGGRGRKVHLIAEGADHPRRIVSIEIPPDTDVVRHDFVLEPRAPVTGRVVDQHGVPVPGVRLSLGARGGIHYDSTPKTTGEDGRFAFPDAIPSQDDLWVVPPEPRAAFDPLPRWTVARRDGETVVLQRFAGDLVDLRVTVVDGETGEPAAPGEVLLGAVHGWTSTRGPVPRTTLALGRVEAPGLRPGRYRLTVRATDGRRAERTIDVRGPETGTELRLWRPASVVCTLDPGAMDAAARRGMIVVLLPRHEQAYAVDDRGAPLGNTPNTGRFEPGKTDRFRLERLTPNVPLCLRLDSAGDFAEAWFTAKPGAETRITLRPERSGTLAFRIPASVPAGATEVDVWTDGVWRPAADRYRPAAQATSLAFPRRPGEVRWRLRHFVDGSATPIEHTGTHEVRAGATTDVPWPGR